MGGGAAVAILAAGRSGVAGRSFVGVSQRMAKKRVQDGRRRPKEIGRGLRRNDRSITAVITSGQIGL